jgi:hypothetical protein
MMKERMMLLVLAESVEEASEDFARDARLIGRVANAFRVEAAGLRFHSQMPTTPCPPPNADDVAASFALTIPAPAGIGFGFVID